ncbi:metalloprotease [Sphingobacteriaceae bacterium]|nr:metalloprotease [Sphingobacteriaceae bacterium]
MKWFGGRESGNVEDRRGMSTGGFIAGGGIGATLLYLLFNFIFGNDAGELVRQVQTNAPQTSEQGVTSTNNAEEDQMATFSSVVLGYTEDVWNKIFSENGRTYQEPKLVLFSNSTESACGSANSATGPFYCPGDQKVYIDLAFFNELKERFGAAGDFANAYVIAHEVGHHIQYLMGTSEKIHEAQQTASKKQANKLSVALELQADFYAGVWAHYNQEMKNVMEPGDLEEALNAATAIGDDRLQKMSSGRVVPDAFTHGTSAQRAYWFKKGFETGDLSQGNTFKDIQN